MPLPNLLEDNVELIKHLLQLPSYEARVAFLQARHLFNPKGLARLLDVAMDLTRSDPAQARQLSLICAALAGEADAPAIIPRATYIRAQTHALKGELASALELIEAARDSYLALGDSLQALRTNLGLMHVLNEMGRHQEALQIGRAVIERLREEHKIDDPESGLIVAAVYHNQGICYRLMGHYEDALDAYTNAETSYIAAGMTRRLGDIYNNRGIILLHLGRTSEALDAFQAAAVILQGAGDTLLYAQSLINIGDAHLLLGNYARSLAALTEARHLLNPLDALAEAYVLLLQQADVYLALNLYPEALATYREAANYCQDAGMAHYRARALWGMGTARVAQYQYEEAERNFSEAAAHFAAANNIPLLSSVELEQAALQAARGQQATAVATAQQALALVAERKEWLVQQLYAHLRLADLLSAQPEVVESHLLEAARLLDGLVLPHLQYRLYQRLGRLHRQQGRFEAAEQLLTAAVEEIERLRGTLAQEAMRISFLHDKMGAYEELLQLHLECGTISAAFAVAERAKSRALAELLTGLITATPALPADPQQVARFHVLQADLDALYNAFLGSKPGQIEQLSRAVLQARIREIEDEINRLRLQFSTTAPTGNIFSTALSLEAIYAQLPPGLIVLAYHIIGDEILAFVYIAGELQVARRLTSVTVVQERLQRLTAQWDRFLAGQSFVQRHIARLEDSAKRLLADLYGDLFAPLLPYFAGSIAVSSDVNAPTRLAVVPHGLLHQVPFHALFDGTEYLLERFEISYAPSVTVLALCLQRGLCLPGSALILGVNDPLIPAVETEVQAVAQYLPGAVVYLDEQATLEAFQRRAPAADILHLACHGLFRADNPMFSALKLYDGWLKAADVMSVDLAGALVTLSACESGRNQVLAGDEVAGLARAFLGAGATSLAVSLWLVQDETTGNLMAEWYKLLQKNPQMSRAAALRQAQLFLKRTHPHPYYWAPFVLIGHP